MNDNFTSNTTKTAIAAALVAECNLHTETAKTVVEFLTTEGVIDFPVAVELYEGFGG